MSIRPEPALQPSVIRDLKPTQITVGMREVDAKRARWRRESGSRGADYLGRNMVPVVLGPKGRSYLIDHHHLALALHLEGVEHVLTTVVSDLSRLDKQAFWTFLDNRGWMHAFDDEGRRRPYDEIPSLIDGLVDDPYRSLAGALREAGGYAKDTTPFSEFLWADFLRRRIARPVLETKFAKALELALAEAKSRHADYLPGWCGPHEET